jgi:hypothetical protein
MVAWVLHHAYGLDAGCGGAKEAVDLMSLLLLCQLGMGEFLPWMSLSFPLPLPAASPHPSYSFFLFFQCEIVLRCCLAILLFSNVPWLQQEDKSEHVFWVTAYDTPETSFAHCPG